MPITLNLGAGKAPIKGAVNHDRQLDSDRPWITVAHDLNDLPWPWKDCSFDKIRANSVLEHLEIDLVAALDECWRILKPDGLLKFRGPYWQHDNAYADVTHRWRYSLRSLDLFDPDTELGGFLGFYTARKWRFVEGAHFNKKKSSIIATLQVRKE